MNWTNVAASATATQAERAVRRLLESADIQVGGNRPHDIQVHDQAFYRRVLRDGRLGVGESYMDGQWDSPAVDEFIAKLLLARVNERVRDWSALLYVVAARAFNLQNTKRVFQAGERHYDIGNDLYEAMLGDTMSYTCGYWATAKNLDQAQRAKLGLVCRKVGLRPGMKVLELGCGWGTFAKYAALNHGVEVTGYTVSKEQVALGKRICDGLPVEFRLEDYRNARGAYDAVISIGMMEHVGRKNHRRYFEVVDRCLKPGGVAFVHTIGSNVSETSIDSFFHKYLFPNALIPSLAQISLAMENLFVPTQTGLCRNQHVGPRRGQREFGPDLVARAGRDLGVYAGQDGAGGAPPAEGCAGATAGSGQMDN
jgi:cyclopropane-fatty-acyl-phospholipid synthase